MHEAQNGADSLRNGGCHGGRADTPIKNGYKQHIQTHIDTCRQDQVVKRMSAVANGVKNANENIVHYDENRTEEIIAKICDGFRQNLSRRAHPAKDHRRQRNAETGQNRTGHQTEGDGGMDGLAHTVVMASAEASGDDHAGAHSQAVEEADHHKDQTAGGADSGQRVVTDIVADAPGVEGVIKLLEYVSQEHRQGEKQHCFPDRALG